MKNKKATYSLIAAFFLIWGVVIYQFFFNEKQDYSVTENVFDNKNNVENNLAIQDSFVLLLDYRDPFVGTKKNNVKPVNPNINKPVISKKIEPKIKPASIDKPININHIKYYGIIKNQNQDKKVGIIYIGSIEYLVYEGLNVEGIEVKKIKDTELDFVHQDKMFTIKIGD